MSSAGQRHGAHQIFSALIPRMPHIRVLEGSSAVMDGTVSFLQTTLHRWETFWQCLPNLDHLDWRIPSCAFSDLSYRQALGLPFNVHTVRLTILWDYGDHPETSSRLMNLSAILCGREWQDAITCLEINTDKDEDDHPAGVVQFGNDSWPVLEEFTCVSRGIQGSFSAPNLRFIKLDIGFHHCSWRAFSDCQRLERVHVKGDCDFSSFDCCSCTRPSTLRHLFLSVGRMTEDGWFSDHQGLDSLHSVHVSFKVQHAGKVDLGAFGAGSRPVSITMEDGIFALWMPLQQDTIWHCLGPA